MNEVDKVFDRLKQKIETLHQQLSELQQENEELISQVLKLSSEQEGNEKRIKELENKALNLQMSSGLSADAKEKLNKRINGLIKEIDKGLELLKR